MYRITIQIATKDVFIPSKILMRRWIKKALRQQIPSADVTIRIVDVSEIIMLNEQYRHKKAPTNVLSFPIQIEEQTDIEIPLIGDIVICAEVVNKEAQEQGKLAEAHWAHMLVHGILHLLGHDHEVEAEALIMENLEIKILQSLMIENPYITVEK